MALDRISLLAGFMRPIDYTKCISAALSFRTVLSSFDSPEARALIKHKCRVRSALTALADQIELMQSLVSIRV